MKSQTLTLLLRCVMLAASLFAFQTLRAQAPPPTFTKITAAPFTVDIGNGHGCAWVDYDNDGFIDLFDSNYNIFQQLPSYLYRNNGNGTFTRQTNGNLVRYVGSTVTSAWADYDNDGFADVFIPDETARDFLYRNNGDGTFTNVAPFVLPAATNSFTWNAAWGDYDNDGHLDLFTSGSISPSPQSIPGRNLLYHNNGNGTFTRITNGIVVNDVQFCVGTAWADYDNDGALDLFVVKALGTNSGTANRLYHNEGNGTFVRVTNGSIATDLGSGLGCAWGDYNNDGFFDLFVPNEMGLKSFLYRNNGDGSFTKIAQGEVVNTVTQSLAAAWADYDNDGYLDLLVVNGRMGFNANHLYRNNGNETFSRVTSVTPATDLGTWHGATWGDYDNDGFLDLFAANWGSPNALYHNNGNSNAWLKVKLRGTVSNRSGIGAKARVKATIGGGVRWQMRQVSGGDGVIQNSTLAHFGLGNATNIDVVRIEWPSGIVQEMTNVAVRQLLTIEERPRLIPGSLAGVFQLMGGKGGRYCIEATTNLAGWECVGHVTNTQALAPFADTDAPSFPQRFYRALKQ
jgi:hypothetical protein